MNDLWWETDFIETQIGKGSTIQINSTVLPFMREQNSVFIGKIGPYSLAYSNEYPLKEGEIREAWELLLSSYSKCEFEIRLPPRIYYEELRGVNFEILLDLGATIIYEDLNYHFDLRSEFRENINRNRTRDIKKLSSNDLFFGPVKLEIAYEIIKKNREKKGIKPSVTIEQLQLLKLIFPERILSHSVEKNGVYLSTSITFVVNPKLSYVFMWGHNPDVQDSGDSLTFLSEGLFNLFKYEKFDFLCLGTASSNGVVDLGLSMYKKSLGAIESRRSVLSITPRIGN